MRVFQFTAPSIFAAVLFTSVWAAGSARPSDPIPPAASAPPTAGATPTVNIEPRPRAADKQTPTPKANIRVDTNVVQIPVTVTDQLNRFVTGLEKENFRVFEDKIEQTVSYFSSEDAPLSVGIVFDTSGSGASSLEK